MTLKETVKEIWQAYKDDRAYKKAQKILYEQEWSVDFLHMLIEKSYKNNQRIEIVIKNRLGEEFIIRRETQKPASPTQPTVTQLSKFNKMMGYDDAT